MPEAASGGERAPEAKPLAPRGAAATVAAKPQTAQAAASLGGHDRFLVFGEGHPVLPADFLIGALAASDGDARLKPFSLLRASLAKGELDSQAFAENSARISSLVFGKALSKAKPIRELRLGAPQTVAGGAAFRFRLLGDELSALGEAILQNESGGWRIEHFELDREALALPRQKPEGWEPPLALYP